ncbi:MAG: hypothetical protein QOF92_2333 [Pseudonocardiales bacterium]|jgi:hypothetical protein|nr:hypothetical protein [Pseudonocardiales bacterium]MDT4951065.1 hypothetical protein [Pseudonocardiales bacterium]
MSTQLSLPVTQPAPETIDVTEPLRCGMCEHDVENHDRISLRYCAATAAGALGRSCICS